MREDPRVAIAIVSAFLAPLIGAIDAFEAFWSARDDPTWETRWQSLDPTERSWLAVIATSRAWTATLTDPEEIRLAKGCRRRESRRRLDFDLVALPVLLAAATLVLIGVGGGLILLSVFFGFGSLRTLWLYRRDRQIKKAYQQAKDNYGALTAPDPAPTA
jgi:Flp pilus assembly protein TadB